MAGVVHDQLVGGHGLAPRLDGHAQLVARLQRHPLGVAGVGQFLGHAAQGGRETVVALQLHRGHVGRVQAHIQVLAGALCRVARAVEHIDGHGVAVTVGEFGHIGRCDGGAPQLTLGRARADGAAVGVAVEVGGDGLAHLGVGGALQRPSAVGPGHDGGALGHVEDVVDQHAAEVGAQAIGHAGHEVGGQTDGGGHGVDAHVERAAIGAVARQVGDAHVDRCAQLAGGNLVAGKGHLPMAIAVDGGGLVGQAPGDVDHVASGRAGAAARDDDAGVALGGIDHVVLRHSVDDQARGAGVDLPLHGVQAYARVVARHVLLAHLHLGARINRLAQGEGGARALVPGDAAVGAVGPGGTVLQAGDPDGGRVAHTVGGAAPGVGEHHGRRAGWACVDGDAGGAVAGVAARQARVVAEAAQHQLEVALDEVFRRQGGGVFGVADGLPIGQTARRGGDGGQVGQCFAQDQAHRGRGVGFEHAGVGGQLDVDAGAGRAAVDAPALRVFGGGTGVACCVGLAHQHLGSVVHTGGQRKAGAGASVPMRTAVHAVRPTGVGLQACDAHLAHRGHAVGVVPAGVIGQGQGGGDGGAVVHKDVAGAHAPHLGEQVQAGVFAHQACAHGLDADDLDVVALAQVGGQHTKQQLVGAAAADKAGLGGRVVDEHIQQRAALHVDGFVEADHQVDGLAPVQQPIGLRCSGHAHHDGHLHHAQLQGGFVAQAGQVGGLDAHGLGRARVGGQTGDDAIGAHVQAFGQAGGFKAQAVVGVDIGKGWGHVEFEQLAHVGLGVGQGGGQRGRFVDVGQPDLDGLDRAVAHRIADLHLQGVAARIGLEVFGVGPLELAGAAHFELRCIGGVDEPPAQALGAGHGHGHAVGAVFGHAQLLGHGGLNLVEFFLGEALGLGSGLRLVRLQGAVDHRVGRAALGGAGLWVVEHRLGLLDACQVVGHRVGLQGLVQGLLRDAVLLLLDGVFGVGLAFLGLGQLGLCSGLARLGRAAVVVGQPREGFLGLVDAALGGLVLGELLGQGGGGDFFGRGFVGGQVELLGQCVLVGFDLLLGRRQGLLGGGACSAGGVGGQAIEGGLGGAERVLGRADELALQGHGLRGGGLSAGLGRFARRQLALGALGRGERVLGGMDGVGIARRLGLQLLQGGLRGHHLGLGVDLGLHRNVFGAGFVGRGEQGLIGAGLGQLQGGQGGGFVGAAGVVVSGLCGVGARQGALHHVGGDFLGGGFIGQRGQGLVDPRLGRGQRVWVGLGLRQGLLLQQASQGLGVGLFGAGLEGGGALGQVDAGVGFGQCRLCGAGRGAAGGRAVEELLRLARLGDRLRPGVAGDFVSGDEIGLGLHHLLVARQGLVHGRLRRGLPLRGAGAVQGVERLGERRQVVGDEFLLDRQGGGFVDLRVFLGAHRLQGAVELGQCQGFGGGAGVGVVQHLDGGFGLAVSAVKGQRGDVVDHALLGTQGLQRAQRRIGHAQGVLGLGALGVQGQFGLGLGLEGFGAVNGAGQLALVGHLELGGLGQSGFLGVGPQRVLGGPLAQGRVARLLRPVGVGAGTVVFKADPARQQGLTGGLLTFGLDLLQNGHVGKRNAMGNFCAGHALGQQDLRAAAAGAAEAGRARVGVDLDARDHGGDHGAQVARVGDGGQQTAIVVDRGVGVAAGIGHRCGHGGGDVHVAQAQHLGQRLVGVGDGSGGERGGRVAGSGGLGGGFAGGQRGRDFGQWRDVGGDGNAGCAHKGDRAQIGDQVHRAIGFVEVVGAGVVGVGVDVVHHDHHRAHIGHVEAVTAIVAHLGGGEQLAGVGAVHLHHQAVAADGRTGGERAAQIGGHAGDGQAEIGADRAAARDGGVGHIDGHVVLAFGAVIERHPGLEVERCPNHFEAGRIGPAQGDGVGAQRVIGDADVGHLGARGGAGGLQNRVAGQGTGKGHGGGGLVCGGCNCLGHSPSCRVCAGVGACRGAGACIGLGLVAQRRCHAHGTDHAQCGGTHAATGGGPGRCGGGRRAGRCSRCGRGPSRCSGQCLRSGWRERGELGFVPSKVAHRWVGAAEQLLRPVVGLTAPVKQLGIGAGQSLAGLRAVQTPAVGPEIELQLAARCGKKSAQHQGGVLRGVQPHVVALAQHHQLFGHFCGQ